MSAKARHARAAVKLAVFCGLVSVGASSAADDEELPDSEFLEYLGSWDASDEEWLLFDAEDPETAAQEQTPQNDRAADRASAGAPADEESTELEKNEG